MPLAKCSFGMIPLSHHPVDRSPRAFHFSTHNVVRASCFEVLSASVDSRKLFLDVSLWLGRALAMEWVSRVIFLEAAICVGGNLSAYVERGYTRQCIKRGIGVAFKQPVIIIHVSFRAMSTWPVCLERPHEEQVNSAVEKQSANEDKLRGRCTSILERIMIAEALNVATNEVRKCKQNFEYKLAQNIKSVSKSFCVRSKKNVQDKVRPVENNVGNIMTERFLMAQELNNHFSSTFVHVLQKLHKQAKELADLKKKLLENTGDMKEEAHTDREHLLNIILDEFGRKDVSYTQ